MKCKDCQELKPSTEFRWRNKPKGLRLSRCKACDSIKRKEHYRNNKEQYRRREQRYLANRQAKDAVEPSHKECFDCGEAKPIEDFRWKDEKSKLRICRCSDCDANHRAELYEDNKQQFLDNNKRNYKKLREVMDGYKQSPCHDCGESYPTYVMDFHHRDRKTKIAKVSAMVYKGSLKLLLEEIAKCDLVCANCHRERTFNKGDKT
jgi:Zn-finger protein